MELMVWAITCLSVFLFIGVVILVYVKIIETVINIRRRSYINDDTEDEEEF